MGRPAFEPTPEQREAVRIGAAVGTKHAVIAQMIGVSPPTLAKYFREELDSGLDYCNQMVAGTLFRMAVSGEHPAATFFWLKTRARWRESATEIQLSSGDAAAEMLAARLDEAARRGALADHSEPSGA